ncbi:glycosyltransferase family 4 protein [Azospirillum sp.]|uniref:glycosyltransferase family 4 protein n=1 Tax=Azospirillum sp. TaxID=34012 RepID=UPI002D27B9EA|nr:glycosyltransferase family 4 protein [Azospirillum sp.]HYD67081.1 glycosyltransferase family 4 protein [Azospirillum sp.]
MRILMVDPPGFTPAYDAALVAGLRGLGHEVLFVTAAGTGDWAMDPPPEAWFYPEQTFATVRRLPAPVRRGIKAASHLLSMRRLIRRAEAFRPDVIHFQWMPLPVVDARLLGRLRRIAPVVLTVHDSTPYNGSRQARLLGLGTEALWRGVDHLIVHTAQAAEQFVQGGHRADGVSRIAHGLLHEELIPRNAPPRAADGVLRLLQFGKVQDYKGVDVLLRAVALLPDGARQRLRVTVAGKPYLDTKPLEELAAACGPGIVRLDFRFLPDAELGRCIAEADALVFPYRQIDVSGVLMAAMAFGKPVVASNLGGFAEMLAGGEEALLVEPGSAEALRDALLHLLDAPERLPGMAAAMARRGRDLPDWRAIAARTADAYALARHTHRQRPGHQETGIATQSERETVNP